MLQFFVLLLVSNISLATDFQFSFTPPTGWHRGSPEDEQRSMRKSLGTLPGLKEIMKSHRGSILLELWTKANPKTVKGAIPTIKINLRPAMTTDPLKFRTMLEQSISSMKASLPEFKVTEELTETEISGKKAWRFTASYHLPGETKKNPITSETVAVMNGITFYQINFTDVAGENNREAFRKSLDSLKL